jgi:hypothetical protein
LRAEGVKSLMIPKEAMAGRERAISAARLLLGQIKGRVPVDAHLSTLATVLLLDGARQLLEPLRLVARTGELRFYGAQNFLVRKGPHLVLEMPASGAIALDIKAISFRAYVKEIYIYEGDGHPRVLLLLRGAVDVSRKGMFAEKGCQAVLLRPDEP